MSRLDSETALENAAIALFRNLRWGSANCFDEVFGPTPGTIRRPDLGREATADVVLLNRLRPALEKLNPTASTEALNAAVEEPTCDTLLLKMVSGRLKGWNSRVRKYCERGAV